MLGPASRVPVVNTNRAAPRPKEAFVSYQHGKFVWFEHVSNDIAKARKFYDALFDWDTEAMPMGEQRYFMIHNGAEGVGGYCMADPGETTHWVGYVSVDDVDAAYAKALAAGAKSLMEPGSFGSVGRGAALSDPTGAVVALWKGSQGDRPDPRRLLPGDWAWNELWTSDDAKALEFYTGVFGYTVGTMDMRKGKNPYYVLNKDGIPRAGLSRSVQPKAPSMWLPYIAVDNCDARAAKAQELGGQVVKAPTDTSLGRYAVLVDPLGAPIAILKPVAS